ncbi:MAG: phosphodiester glycosidase family protein [Firmicutes bacterium]|nr:phosphodiester glycosidase family protein [Bacillota bacterium]
MLVRKGRVLAILPIVVLIIILSGLLPSFAGAGEVKLEVLPEEITLYLPQVPGRKYEVTSFSHPMKVVVDVNQPLLGMAEVLAIDDVALARMRYSQEESGAARLVLDFKYQLPAPLLEEEGQFLKLTVMKKFVQASERFVTTGVTYGHQRRGDSFGPNIVNYLEIQTRFTGIQVKLGLAQDKVLGSEFVSDIALRHKAIAAVNGAFFASSGLPLGVFMIDGELISEPYAKRTALGLGPRLAVMDHLDLEAKILFEEGSLEITGLNRPRGENDLILYTPFYGKTTRTNEFGLELTVIEGQVTALQKGASEIPSAGVVLSGHGLSKRVLETLDVGDQIQIITELDPKWDDLGVQQIIGGGPRLVKNGEIFLTGKEEKFQNDVLVGRAPRTALGITADGKLLLVTVNGRKPNISVGMSLEELADLLLELGAVEAMNLDGGGSTTMVIRDLVLNLPSDGKERPVSNAILIIAPEGRR